MLPAVRTLDLEAAETARLLPDEDRFGPRRAAAKVVEYDVDLPEPVVPEEAEEAAWVRLRSHARPCREDLEMRLDPQLPQRPADCGDPSGPCLGRETLGCHGAILLLEGRPAGRPGG